MTVIRIISVAGVTLGIAVFALLSASFYIVRRVDQELAEMAASTMEETPQRVVTPAPRPVSAPTVRAGGNGWAVPVGVQPLISKEPA